MTRSVFSPVYAGARRVAASALDRRYVDIWAGNSAPSGAVLITGTVAVGETLTADATSVADADGLGTFSYQWLRGGVPISGATASTYTVTLADVGFALQARVSFTDGAGKPESVTSSATAVVAGGVSGVYETDVYEVGVYE